MARGYLGKISAIVTANTGDYVRKLNESASETRNFAKTVESTLRSASRDAAKSLQGIYTPLQQFERALRAAASQRLSFKGFDGAINTVEQLKQRLATIRDADINVVVKASGLNTITDLKLAIKDISQADIDLFRNVGGLAGLRKLRADIEATRNAAGDITVKPRVDPTELDRLIETFSVIDDRQIQVVMDVLGQRELDATVTKMRQLRDVSEQLQKPLAAAAEKFDQLSQPIQGAFIPALARAQDAVEAITADIQAGVPVSQKRFEDLAAAVGVTTRAVDELRVAQASLSKIRTGREFEFQQPGAEAALTRAAAVDPTSLPAGARTANQKQFSDAQSAVRREAEELERLLAVRKAAEAAGASPGTLSTLQAQIDTRVRLLNEETEAYERLARAAKNAADATDDRNADRIGASSPMDRNAGNIGAFTSIRGMESLGGRLVGPRTDISNMGLSTPFFPGNGRSNPTGPFGPELPPGFGGRGDAGLGEAIQSAQRGLELLRGQITSAKSALDDLPDTVKTRFIPAITEAEDEFRRLAASPTATRQEIDAAAAAVTRLGTNIKNTAKFADTLNKAFVSRRESKFTADYTALQGVLVKLGATTGQTAVAFDRLSSQAQEFAAAGTLASDVNLRKLRALEDEVIKLAAEYSGLTVQQLKAQQAIASTRLSGDIGRGGADKASLALNQLAFAIDDFLSSTGGIEFKLRAISNNITQLGFIAGGTAGLFISLGAVIGSQVAIAIAKFVFETDKADAALGALNSALENNQRNVEQLAESYRRLADEIAKATLSPRDNIQRDRNQRRDELNRQRRQAEEEAFASQSPEVARVRGERSILQDRLKESRDVEERLKLQKQIQDNVERERRLLESRGGREGESIINRAAEQGQEARRVVLNRARGFGPFGGRPQAEVDAAREELDRARARRAAAAATALPGATTSANTRQQLSALQESLAAAQADFEAAQASGVRTSRQQGQTPRPDLRNIDALEQTIQDLESRIEVVSTILGGQIASELIDSGFRIQDALSQVSDGLSSVDFVSALQQERDKLARELTKIADELGQVSDPARAEELRKQQEEIEKNSNALLSATRSVEGFAAVLDRVAGKLADTVLGEVEGLAERARRQANAAQGAVETPILSGNREQVKQERALRAREATEQRNRAEAEVRRARAGQAEFRRRERAALEGFEADARAGRLGAQAQGLIATRDEQRRILDDPTASVEQKRAAADLLDSVTQQLDSLFESSPAGRALAAFADSLDRAAQSAAEFERQVEAQRESARRGRQLSMTPGQRAGEEIRTGLEDINNYFDTQQRRILDQAGGIFDINAQEQAQLDANEQQRNEARARFEEDQRRAAAPAVFALSDAVQNAILQGPSRAALNAADVTTMEGSRELNRLLRGDDPAKDVNLLELQKQTKLLEDIAKKEPLPVV